MKKLRDIVPLLENFILTHPMRKGKIGKFHNTLDDARGAAKRALKNLDHVSIRTWRGDKIETHFSDGLVVGHTDEKA